MLSCWYLLMLPRYGGRGRYQLFEARVLAGPSDVPGKAGFFQCRDDQSADVQLVPTELQDRRGWEGVMVVVPGLAEREDCEPEVVGAPVPGGEIAPPEDVSEGGDAPDHVVACVDTDQTSPGQPLTGADPAAVHRCADGRRND